MNDFKLIAELAGRNKHDRWEVLKGLGDEAAAHFRRVLPLAFETHRGGGAADARSAVSGSLLARRHNSPNDQWLPHFTCHAVGEAILEMHGRSPG